jgi:hypothetical protein
VALSGSKGAPLGFMYPQVETDRGRRDPLDPAAVKHEITQPPSS